MEKAKVRESNIELLRNISMFMILIIHANFVSLPHLQYNDFISNIVPSIMRCTIESFGIVAVNVFVFITGWFGLNINKKRVLSFIFQILFLVGGGGILLILLGRSSFSVGWLLDVFQLSRKDWFIKSYFVLMIISPILNTFSKTTEEKIQRILVIAFFMFEAVYGWVMGGRRFFLDGYGPLHFIGLYITAQYIHNRLKDTSTPLIIKKIFTLPYYADLGVFFLIVIINTIFYVSSTILLHDATYLFSAAYAYSNPLVMIGAVYLFLFFSKLKMPHVKAINWLGASSFAVYLIHTETTVMNTIFTPIVQCLFDNYSGLICVGYIFSFLCVVYISAVLIDQLRIFSWKKLLGLISKD